MVTLSIQADEELQAALQERATLQGKTVSDLAREILREAIAQRPLGERVGHLRGRLELPSAPSDPWRSQLKERNWRS
jgi:plasmid stability protein